MDNLNFIADYVALSIKTKQDMLSDTGTIENIGVLADRICDTYAAGNKVILAGNGGSAATITHAAEFVSRFHFDRPGLPHSLCPPTRPC